MQYPVVIIGIGEIGGVLARGLLKCGHPVQPVSRETDVDDLSKNLPQPAAVIVAVGEKDLHPVLERVPKNWRDSLILIQNELLPRDWRKHGLGQPTVISVWFEKKKDQDVKIVVPSPIFGPRGSLLKDVLKILEIPSVILNNEDELQFELVRKNLYILVSNICGLKVDGTVGELWRDHERFAREVASDVLDIQESLVNESLDRDQLITAMLTAFNGDPDHQCMGRSAPARLERALEQADETGLAVKHLRKIQKEQI